MTTPNEAVANCALADEMATVLSRRTVRVVDGADNPIRLGEVLAVEEGESRPPTDQRRVVGAHATPAGRR